ncbi:hypothetical protein V6N11_037234 [Hibiscus sabdariffa]|uniref:Uncharacterized protein n=1 Tax=Hibiscus sabdariffa TaxID=183260 RepID=A0ABR2P0Y2_9ROSI
MLRSLSSLRDVLKSLIFKTKPVGLVVDLFGRRRESVNTWRFLRLPDRKAIDLRVSAATADCLTARNKRQNRYTAN